MKYRMYFFVPYNISDIQKGIQAGHCAIEYMIRYSHLQEFHDWYVDDKTWIILNGGTTRYSKPDSDLENGTLNKIDSELDANYINHSTFHEPDLNNALTALCFIADERVWDYENYPDWLTVPTFQIYHKYEDWVNFIGGEKNLFLRNLIKDKRLA